ncbi:septation protein IspZ [Bdellovibrio sp. PAP01]|uniref:Septation protein IspZ n=2 Tax=Bdellovibrio svalbardensis TaxID=2972972 RepID=A0ABT6DJ31_9BACT|nr:septation protein IspZ [Bdellovibrio svalbardensis]
MSSESASPKTQAMGLFVAGILPVIAFTIIEEYYGTIAGLIAGMVFGVGEISWELYKHKKVQKITWIGNGMLLVLGGISLISSEGIWFKLQPALMEGLFAIFCWGSLLFGKPLIVYLAEQQGQQFPDVLKDKMWGVTLRTGLFFAIHTALAIWAAIAWSTTNWALLKGVGLTVSFIMYLGFEGILLRQTIMKEHKEELIRQHLEAAKQKLEQQ